MTKTLDETTKAYLESLKAQGKAEPTLYTYGKDLEQVIAYFGQDKSLEGITPAQVGKFLKSDALLLTPTGKDRAEQTVKKTIRVFRMFLFWAQEQGYIEQVPVTKGLPIGRNSV